MPVLALGGGYMPSFEGSIILIKEKSYTHLSIYQQPGDAKKPYFAQYSAVAEDSPVSISWTTMKTKIPRNNRLKPLKANFNIVFIGFRYLEFIGYDIMYINSYYVFHVVIWEFYFFEKCL